MTAYPVQTAAMPEEWIVGSGPTMTGGGDENYIMSPSGLTRGPIPWIPGQVRVSEPGEYAPVNTPRRSGESRNPDACSAQARTIVPGFRLSPEWRRL